MPFALMESRLWHPELDVDDDEEWEVPEQLTRSQRLSQLKSGLKPPRPKTAPGGGRRAAKQRSEPELLISTRARARRALGGGCRTKRSCRQQSCQRDASCPHSRERAKRAIESSGASRSCS